MEVDFSYEIPVKLGSKTHIVILRIFTVVGILMLGLSGYLIYETTQFLKRAKTVKAHVMHYSTGINDSNKPVFKYRDSYGNMATFKSSVSTSYTRYRIGEETQLLIDPYSSRIENNAFLDLWFFELILAILGSGFVGMSFVHYLFLNKIKRERRDDVVSPSYSKSIIRG